MTATAAVHPREADITTLLGMHTRTAWLIVGINIAGVGFAAFSSLRGVNVPLAVVIAVVMHACSAVALMRMPGDPFPLAATCAVTLAGPVACLVVLAALSVPVANPLQTWPIGTSAGLYTFLCVRGRTGWAWSGYAAILAVGIGWAVTTGQDPGVGLGLVLPSAALLLMGTFFAFAIRSPVRDIFRLREESTRRAAEEAAAAAALDERDAQLTRLDELARPILTLIASGEPLSDEEKLSCRLLEYHLRDTLRAAGLDDVDVHSAARAARSRGVEVVLLDDRGDDPAERVDRHILDAVIAALEDQSLTAVTVRLMPPDRGFAASILVSGTRGTVRRVFDAAGHPVTSHSG